MNASHLTSTAAEQAVEDMQRVIRERGGSIRGYMRTFAATHTRTQCEHLLRADRAALAQLMVAATIDVVGPSVAHVAPVVLHTCEDCSSEFERLNGVGSINVTTGMRRQVCSTCAAAYAACRRCGTYQLAAEGYGVQRIGWICANCHDYGNYADCAACDLTWQTARLMQGQDEEMFCPNCYPSHRAPEGSLCAVPHPEFDFPVLSGNVTVRQQRAGITPTEGQLHNDDRFTVELACGVVDANGMARIADMVYAHYAQTSGEHARVAHNLVEGFDPTWQTKAGNLTKRLTKAILQAHLPKLTDAVVSEIGNIASQHSDRAASSFNLSLTREIDNGGGREFANEGSCWWGSYHYSRCQLKQNGGMGLRTWTEGFDRATGRAWVMPVVLDGDWAGTHDTDSGSYVVFNPYGSTGWTYARMLAQMTGKSYRKIHFTVEGMYVNGSLGWLVSDTQTCEATGRIDLHPGRKCTCRRRD